MKQIPLQLPEINPLFDDYLYRFDQVSEFYPQDWRNLSPEGLIAHTAFHKPLNRTELSRVVEAQNRAWGAAAPALENARSLARENTFAVVTGQQAGIFTGPLYTPYKILTTIATAHRLNHTHPDFRFVPVFWLEVEDNDFREINHIHYLSQDYQLQRLELSETPGEAFKPIYLRQIPPGILQWREQLRQDLPLSEFKEQVLALFFEAYRAGTSFSDAFAQLLCQLFSEAGLVVVNPADRALKALALPIFQKILQEQKTLHQALSEQNARIIEKGYQPQIHLPEGHTMLFWLDDDRRRVRIDRSPEGKFLLRYTGEHRPFPGQDPLRAVEKEPWRMIPGVAVRPLLQDSLLPTRVYVAGPTETAYFAQLAALYRVLNMSMPLILPRHRLTLVEPAIQKIVHKHHLDYADIFLRSKDLLDWFVQSREHAGTFQRVEQIRQDALSILQHLEPLVQETDLTLLKPYQKTMQSIQRSLNQLTGKLTRALQTKHQIEIAQLSRVQMALFPGQKPQERVLNLIYFAVKHGPGFTGQLLKHLPEDIQPHWVVELP
ncbi:MAG: bacillithiol biosynthesis cysteine-adding enzyme BshC [Calditrichaeota bacterium]|nr:MAG: bacillithiol biosynthesis cysteine-adding enzyme BshC [Calditrichota bacterium]